MLECDVEIFEHGGELWVLTDFQLCEEDVVLLLSDSSSHVKFVLYHGSNIFKLLLALLPWHLIEHTILIQGQVVELLSQSQELLLADVVHIGVLFHLLTSVVKIDSLRTTLNLLYLLFVFALESEVEQVALLEVKFFDLQFPLDSPEDRVPHLLLQLIDAVD